MNEKQLMFEGAGTWNPFTGCEGGDRDHCQYCYAFYRTFPRVKHQPKYANGFRPTFHKEVMKAGPPKAQLLFVGSMCDMWCPSMKTGDIVNTLRVCHLSPKVEAYLFLTKWPGRYLEILPDIPELMDDRFYFGTTIETAWPSVQTEDNIPALNNLAPYPSMRMAAMVELKTKMPRVKRFVSVEPLLEFHLETMVKWLNDIDPEFVYAGYDNHNLVPVWAEPPAIRVVQLVHELRKTLVVREKNLRGLRV